MYLLIKNIHMTCAAISLCGFILRGLWMLKQSAMLQQRWVKIAPHIIDTGLLVSAITLAVQLHASPLQHPWMAAKIIALLVYIGLGTVALKKGKTLRARVLAWIAALLTFGYVVSVAITKSPMGIFH